MPEAGLSTEAGQLRWVEVAAGPGRESLCQRLVLAASGVRCVTRNCRFAIEGSCSDRDERCEGFVYVSGCWHRGDLTCELERRGAFGGLAVKDGTDGVSNGRGSDLVGQEHAGSAGTLARVRVVELVGVPEQHLEPQFDAWMVNDRDGYRQVSRAFQRARHQASG
ncbi:MAG: hypothetical protein ACRDPA_33530 [Solirubrobacteraceae bacterium]